MRHGTGMPGAVMVMVVAGVVGWGATAWGQTKAPTILLETKEVSLGRVDPALIPGSLKASPNSKRVAYVAKHGEKWEVVVDGLEGKEYADIGKGFPIFSADSKRTAYIAKAGVTAPTEDEFKAYLREHLLPYQIPVYIKQVSELPRTPSMKVSQPALKALFEQEPDLYLSREGSAPPGAMPPELPPSAGREVRDPVCGMRVDAQAATAAGRKSDYKGTTYSFCSDDCKEKFAKEPARYVKDKEAAGISAPPGAPA